MSWEHINVYSNKKECVACGKSLNNKHIAQRYCMKCPGYCLSRILIRACLRASKTGIPHDIDLNYIMNLWIANDGKCALTGLPFKLEKHPDFRVHPHMVSIDQIKAGEGYIKGNVRLITHHANVALNVYGENYFNMMMESYLENKSG